MHDRTRNVALSQPQPSEPDVELDQRTGPRRPPPGLALDPPDDPPPDHPPEIPVDRLDPEALRVIARLRHMHHQAYFVGGCVRDLLLGHTPKDFDVATDAHPGEVRAIFRNCRLIGRRFRLAHVYFRGGKVIEVATFRKNPTDLGVEDAGDDGDLLITRDNVFGSAEEDAVRRDFTVNGLFYDVARGEVIDYVGGRADLDAARIHTIGDPDIRIREDPVRSLRAVRFAARLGCSISPDTFEAMRRYAAELARCAPARVLEEIFKILRCGGSARAFHLLRACGALPVVLPALGTAMDGWDEGRRRGFSAHLTGLDRLVRSGAEVSDAVLLGALVMHLGPTAAPDRAELDGEADREPRGRRGRGPASTEPPRHEMSEADVLLASLVSTSRLPRRVAERVRLALNALRNFRDPPRRRRGRGGTQHVDAQQLLEITVEATGQGRELLERWAQGRPEGGPPEPVEAAEPRRGRRGPRSEERPAGRPEPVSAAVEARVGWEVSAEAEADGPDEEEHRTIAVGAAPAAEGEGQPGARRRRRHRGGRRRRRRGVGGAGPEGGASAPPGAAGGEGRGMP